MDNIYEVFHRDGIAVIPNFFNEEEISEMLEAGRQMCYDAPKNDITVFTTTDPTSAQNREKYFLESGDKIRYFFESGAVGETGELIVPQEIALNKVGHALHTDHPVFKKYTFSSKVQEVLRKLKYKRPVCVQSMYIYKNPGIGGEVISHQDSSYLYTNPPSCIGLWTPLEDSTIENGCLKAIKGSHKTGVHRKYVRNPNENSNELIIYDRPAIDYPLSDFTDLPVTKGSLVLIHGEVVHRSEHNKSDKSRHAYTVHIVESKGAEYAKNNWLQPNPKKPFPAFYDN